METTTDETKTAEKAGNEKDVIGRLAGKGEEAIRRIADLPGGQRAVEAFNDLKVRVDDLSRRVRGIDALEQRVAKLEKEVSALRRAQKPTTEKAPTRNA